MPATDRPSLAHLLALDLSATHLRTAVMADSNRGAARRGQSSLGLACGTLVEDATGSVRRPVPIPVIRDHRPRVALRRSTAGLLDSLTGRTMGLSLITHERRRAATPLGADAPNHMHRRMA